MHQLFLAGKWTAGAEVRPVISPWDGHTGAEVHRAGPEHYRPAIDGAVEAAKELKSLAAHRIADALERMKAFASRYLRSFRVSVSSRSRRAAASGVRSRWGSASSS